MVLTASVGDVVDNGDGTWSWSFATTDGTDQTGPVTITATDDAGEQATTSFTLLVNNEAPTITLDQASITTTEGAIASNSGQFGDAGADLVTLTTTLGNVVDNGDGTWSWTWPASDAPNVPNSVSITATDSDGASTTETFSIQVDNVAPTLTVDNATITVNEGTIAGNSGSLGDAGDDVITLSVTLGTATDNGNGTWNWSYTAGDGPSDSQTVTVTVTDSDNVSTSVDFALVVENVAPDLTINDDSLVVVEGSTITNGGTISDIAGDPVSVTASAGTVVDNGNGTWSWSFDSTDGPDETQTVSITAEDDDAGVTVETFQLTVTNAAPTLTIDNANVVVGEGVTATNAGTVADLGLDNITLTASFGTVTQNAGTWSWSYESTGVPDESQTVMITATDSDGATSDVSFDFVVTNVPPVVAVDVATLSTPEGSQVSNTGTFADVGGDIVSVSSDEGNHHARQPGRHVVVGMDADGRTRFAASYGYGHRQ